MDDPRVSRRPLLTPTVVLVAATTAVVSSLGAPLIPTIARADHVTLSTAQWVLTAALLVGAVVTPIFGRMADGAYQRRVVLGALVAALAGCVIAATGPTFAAIVVGRLLQGVGLGLLPVTMAIVRRHLDPEEAHRIIAVLSISNIIGVGLGYPVTGLIAEGFDFHGAYWFGAITIAVSLTLAAFVLPGPSSVEAAHFDVVGGATLGLAIIGLSVLLSEGSGWGWTSWRSIAVTVGSAGFVGWWIPHELHVSRPLIDLRQVRHRSVLTADASGFVICVVMYLFIPVIVEFAQVPRSSGYGFGSSIVVAGLLLVPLAVGTYLANQLRALYERRFGVRTMIPLGSVAFAIASAFFAFEHRSLWEAFVTVGIAGLGAGFTFAAMPGLIVRAVPVAETGSALGFYQVLRSIGLSVGSALAAAVLSANTARGHTFPDVSGFRTALIVAAAMCLVAAMLSFVLTGAGPDAVAAGESEPDDLVDEDLVREAPL